MLAEFHVVAAGSHYTRHVDLARLYIEFSIASQVDFDSVIRNFVNKNARKSLTQ